MGFLPGRAHAILKTLHMPKEYVHQRVPCHIQIFQNEFETILLHTNDVT